MWAWCELLAVEPDWVAVICDGQVPGGETAGCSGRDRDSASIETVGDRVTRIRERGLSDGVITRTVRVLKV